MPRHVTESLRQWQLPTAADRYAHGRASVAALDAEWSRRPARTAAASAASSAFASASEVNDEHHGCGNHERVDKRAHLRFAQFQHGVDAPQRETANCQDETEEAQTTRDCDGLLVTALLARHPAILPQPLEPWSRSPPSVWALARPLGGKSVCSHLGPPASIEGCGVKWVSPRLAWNDSAAGWAHGPDHCLFADGFAFFAWDRASILWLAVVAIASASAGYWLFRSTAGTVVPTALAALAGAVGVCIW